MKRKVCSFDAFASACQYFNGDTNVNNGYGCDHPEQEENCPDDDGIDQGLCYCSSCPLGVSPDIEDWNNPNVDFDGIEYDNFNFDSFPNGECSDDDFIMVNVEESATDDEKQALYNYECRLNRYNKDWDGGTWKHLHRR